MNELLRKLVNEIAIARYSGRWLMVCNEGRFEVLFGRVSGDALEQRWNDGPGYRVCTTPDEAARDAIRLEMLPAMWTSVA